MPKPMYRSNSWRKIKKTINNKGIIHYKRKANSQPHCAICSKELNGISKTGGKTRKTNARIFGGVLCAKCTQNIVKAGNRVEQGVIKLNEVGIKERKYVLQLVAH
ncbi:50S ribosomal protein L34e [Candidatus Marsarchaeota archaeon]|nr:50S ribosomal protein L34e [Candidatus Marsarchaeota archaeon]